MKARILIPALCAAALCAQNLDRTFYFTNGESPQNLTTIMSIVRSVGEIQQVTTDAAHQSVAVSGTPGQIAIAGWLCHELNQPAAEQAPHEYPVPGSDPPAVVRVYFLDKVRTPQELQEITNATRSITGIRAAFPYALSSALAIRGSAAEVAAADWVLRELNQDGQTQTTQNFSLPEVPNQVAKIFYLKNTVTPQGLQELVNVTRSIADIQRFFPYQARNAIVARGSAEQMDLAAWLVQQLDEPSHPQPVNEYRLVAVPNPLVRVFYLANTQTPLRLMEIVSEVRTAVNVQRIYPFNLRNALTVRGTADQISRAEQMIRERDR